MTAGAWFVGVDVGGTFTDLAAVDQRNGRVVVAKELTTPDDPIAGILDVLRSAFGAELSGLADCSGLLHGTTLAINTLIERKGARVGLITTAGFRDVIETGREDRYDLYDLQIEAPQPIVPRELRVGVAERVGPRGEVLTELDSSSVQKAVAQLRRAGVESVAVCFLNAYANDAHERATVELVAAGLPSAYVSRSSDVAPIIREYERFLATVVNSYIGPTVATYLGSVSAKLLEHGFVGQLGIMKSDGGVCTPAEASRIPVQMLESGPAAGATFAARLASACDLPRVLAFDMGGTTAKACLVLGGSPILTEELEVDRRERLRQGSGLPLRVPSIDLMEIGAGGGSIAGIGPLGLVQVGPRSAGARPGPACYRLGGDRPTVTDADLVLGYLRADSFSAGGPTLDREAALEAIRRDVAEPLGLEDPVLAAWAIHDLVNENMAQAARLHCIEHGVDPEAVWLVATGGAGPLHAGGLLEKLGSHGVIFSRSAGVASAMGLVLAPWSIERTRTDIHPLGSLTLAEIGTRLAAIERLLPESSFPADEVTLTRQLHMRIRGQAYEVKVDAPSPLSIEALAGAFRSRYVERFGLEPASDELEVVTWGIRRVERSRRDLGRSAATGGGPRTSRPGFMGPAAGWCEVDVVPYADLREGEQLDGPLLVEDETTTIVVRPGQTASLDELGNLRVTTRVSG